jgi:hypothetical protein
MLAAAACLRCVVHGVPQSIQKEKQSVGKRRYTKKFKDASKKNKTKNK